MGESFENTEAWKSARILTNWVYARRSCGEVRSMSFILLDNQFISPTEHAELVAH